MSKRAVFLRTDHVCLVPIHAEKHVENSTRWKNDPEIARYLSMVPPITQTLELEILRKAEVDPSQRPFAIETIRGRHIGMTDLHGIQFHEGIAHSGSLIGECRNKGYGTHAKMLLLRYAFHHLGLRKIYAKVIDGNEGCLAHLKHCGYKEEARLKAHYFREGRYRDQIVLSVFCENFSPLWEVFSKKHILHA